MKIAVLLPTYYRPYGLRRCLQSIRDTVEFDAVENLLVHAIVIHEHDDKEVNIITKKYNTIQVETTEPNKGCSNAWNTGLATYPNYDAYILGADDMYFMYGIWNEIIKQFNAGFMMIGFNENCIYTLQVDKRGVITPPSNCYSHYILTREFIVKYNGGVMAFPHYKAYKNDNETFERAKRANCAVYAADANIKHDWKKSATFHLSAEKDKRMFRKRKAEGFPNDFPRILEK